MAAAVAAYYYITTHRTRSQKRKEIKEHRTGYKILKHIKTAPSQSKQK